MPPKLRAATGHILTKSHLCGGIDHRPLGAALLIKWHPHSQLSVTSRCLFYLFQEAQARDWDRRGGQRWGEGRFP